LAARLRDAAAMPMAPIDTGARRGATRTSAPKGSIMAVTAYKRILVPVDGSAAAARGLAEGIRLAKAVGADLAVVHVIDTVTVLGYAEVTAYAPQITDSLQTAGRKIVADASRRAEKADVACTARVLDAAGKSVSDVILAEARRTRASVIAMGTHGRRGLVRTLMGSDAQAVVRDSPVPVMLVRGD
jgi:nucleotide-binding universal stress UspA family protein